MLSSPGARRGSGVASVGTGWRYLSSSMGWASGPCRSLDEIRRRRSPQRPGGSRRRRRLPLARPRAHDALRTDVGGRGRPSRRRVRPLEERALPTTGTRQELREATDLEGCARRPDRPTGRGLSDAGRRALCSTRLALQCGPPQGPLRGSWRCPDRNVRRDAEIRAPVWIVQPGHRRAVGQGRLNGATMDSAGGMV